MAVIVFSVQHFEICMVDKHAQDPRILSLNRDMYRRLTKMIDLMDRRWIFLEKAFDLFFIFHEDLPTKLTKFKIY
ncbi:uncharacterized protein FFB20_09613 [Fusarium fujikuroi]|nr:uncharacterized protein FFB20_09613 [Fusarium fujikuroi]SCO28265.1 uncharacterized protein FFNC_00231 [Fusarium fujikuroi]SCV26356.1 uncharacterized protein FFFS_00231 [Fusarium fujikuroi]